MESPGRPYGSVAGSDENANHNILNAAAAILAAQCPEKVVIKKDLTSPRVSATPRRLSGAPSPQSRNYNRQPCLRPPSPTQERRGSRGPFTDHEDMSCNASFASVSVRSEMSVESRLSRLSRRSVTKRQPSAQERERMEVDEARRKLEKMRRRNEVSCRKALYTPMSVTSAGQVRRSMRLTVPKEFSLSAPPTARVRSREPSVSDGGASGCTTPRPLSRRPTPLKGSSRPEDSKGVDHSRLNAPKGVDHSRLEAPRGVDRSRAEATRGAQRGVTGAVDSIAPRRLSASCPPEDGALDAGGRLRPATPEKRSPRAPPAQAAGVGAAPASARIHASSLRGEAAVGTNDLAHRQQPQPASSGAEATGGYPPDQCLADGGPPASAVERAERARLAAMQQTAEEQGRRNQGANIFKRRTALSSAATVTRPQLGHGGLASFSPRPLWR